MKDWDLSSRTYLMDGSSWSMNHIICNSNTFLAKNIIELNSRGSKLVVDDPNFNNDPIQLMSGRAKYKLFGKNSIEIDDFIGAVYNDVKYIGRVTDKDDEKIEVKLILSTVPRITGLNLRPIFLDSKWVYRQNTYYLI